MVTSDESTLIGNAKLYFRKFLNITNPLLVCYQLPIPRNNQQILCDLSQMGCRSKPFSSLFRDYALLYLSRFNKTPHTSIVYSSYSKLNVLNVWRCISKTIGCYVRK